MKKQRWRFTKYKLSYCLYCEEQIYKLNYKNKRKYRATDYGYCTSNCHMMDVDAIWFHFG